MLAQFWSAHGDSAFAALFLLSFVPAGPAAQGRRPHQAGTAVAYTLTVMLASSPAGRAHPLSASSAVRALPPRSWSRSQRQDRRRFFLLLASAGSSPPGWGSRKLGHNPLLNINKGDTQVPGRYLSSVAGVVSWSGSSWLLLVLAVPTSRSPGKACRCSLMLAAYVHVIMVSTPASSFALFRPVVPFMALVVVRGSARRAQVAPRAAGRVRGHHAATIPRLHDVAAQPIFAQVAPADNWGEFGTSTLRLGTQVRMKEALESLNAELPAGATLTT